VKVGDLVKVSNKRFNAIGYIQKITKDGLYLVYYFNQRGWNGRKRGLWAKMFMQLLMDVQDESR